jgi:hypothetical protein
MTITKEPELLKDYFVKTEKTEEASEIKYSAFDKVRMVIEVLLFGWIMPGKKKDRRLD